MSEFRVASRYAKSLIELAQESNSLEAIHEDMALLSRVCDQNRDLSLLLNSPIVKGDKKRLILRAIFEGKMSDLTLTFFDLIVKKRREGFLPFVAKQFHQQYNLLKGIQESTVTTTFPLTKDLRDEFIKLSEKISGMKTDLTEKIDETLIGGFVLKTGDLQLDDSLKSKINELHLALKDTTYKKN